MKIIKRGNSKNGKNFHSEPQKFHIDCMNCGSEFEIDETEFSDFRKCPVCNERADKCLCFEPIINKKKDNASIDERIAETFPDTYYHYGENTKSYKCTDDEIQQMIKRAIKSYKSSPNSNYSLVATGDTVVIVHQDFSYDESDNKNNYEIIVAKNYYESFSNSFEYSDDNDDEDYEDDYWNDRYNENEDEEIKYE